MEPQHSGNLVPLLGVAIVLVVLVIGVVYYFAGTRGAGERPAEVQQASDQVEVATEISAAAQTPAEQLPETNPYSGYKNPFE